MKRKREEQINQSENKEVGKMKNREMKTKVFLAAGVFIVLGFGLLLKFNSNGKDVGLDQVIEELSSMPSIDNLEVVFKEEEFQEEKKITTASKPKVKKESYVFSSVDAAQEPGYIDDLRYSGIEVKEHKEISATNKLMNAYYEKENYPKLEKEVTKELPENSVAGEIIVKSVNWQDSGTYIVDYRTIIVSPEEVINAMSIINDDPNVLSAEPNVTIRINTTSNTIILNTMTTGAGGINDEHFGKQWALQEDKINAPGAWDIIGEEGENVKIAIIDTGVDLSHPDLVGSIDSNEDYDYINNDDEADDESHNSHGTHIAGIIAASFNDIGVRGMVPNATLIIHKIMTGGQDEEVDIVSLGSTISNAIVKGARVINMSWTTEKDMMQYGFLKDTLDAAIASETLLVAAAGNQKVVDYPAAYSGVLAVGGTDENDNRWVDTDSESAYGDRVDVAAPAKDVYSTKIDSDYQYLPGTSMSTAFVSGLAGLLLSQDPDLAKENLINLIKNNADIIYPDEPIGAGRINAQKALAAAAAGLNINTAAGDVDLLYAVAGLNPDASIDDLIIDDYEVGQAIAEWQTPSTVTELNDYFIDLDQLLLIVAYYVEDISVDNSLPTTERIYVSPEISEVGQEVTINAAILDSIILDSVIYVWDFGDDSNLGTEINPSHIYTEVGEYTVTLTVTDKNDSNDTVTFTKDITVGSEGVNQAPDLELIGDKSVIAGDTLIFTVTASDEDVATLSYSVTGLPS
ncbi:MAG: S8 family serine peptidase, partial [Candidatus Kaelpia aquatica]|nr:S8 family serine peptidase [Candidatus Kaelpia aquatica]